MVPNIYQPYPVSVHGVKEETGDIKTFTLGFKDQEIQNRFTFRPGQFVLVSVFNCGEAPISICSSPTFSKGLQLSIKKMGLLTGEIHRYTEGDEVGLRGPYGNGFPLEQLCGHDLLFVGGGIGLAPLRSLIQYVLSKRSQFGGVTILYGARTPQDIVFKDDLAAWDKEEDVQVTTTVYRDNPTWKGEVGPVTRLLEKATISPSNTKAIICGHPAIISYVVFDLLKMGFAEEDIITTLERNMKCGVGKCGHCSIGSKFTCMHGPVFTYREIKTFPTGF
ncbi:MAG: FAD/NAD(P)-binding protein [Deltaproteobacteria bacterium]|nr:FAD/NAD(P)-binding protein [Deltaproteobacteria bacterium]MBW2019585.1 FAD/NAD(P)-binding protein [Deltaproteobacteria bacterium]MBW2074393.1 FAD/NAD(P)-binding protein [Deltaproteobacteria bacterium]RLB82890.1 MAG: hydrogenase [Deltaproteobacteria bacterium]